MAVYIIVQENLHGDQAPFEDYRKQVIGTFTPYGGKFLARGGKVSVLEGEWPYDRSVILEFPSREAAETFYESEAPELLYSGWMGAGKSRILP